MIGRLFSCALVAAFAFTAAPAWAQVSSPASSATAGSSCTGAPANGSSSFFLWPDTSGHILQCNGTTWVTATEPAGAAGSTGYVQYNNGGALAGSANLFWNNSSGYLSIGTTNDLVLDNVSSARPLVVQTASTATTVGSGTNSIAIVNSDTTTNNTSSLIFADITGASTNQYADAEIVAVHGARTNTDYNSGQLAFMTAPGANIAPAERVRIDNNGNVGIGTTAPATGLHVSESNGTAAGIRLSNTSNGNSYTIYNGDSGDNGFTGLGIFDGTAYRLNIGTSGNVGIGTTGPNASLHINGGSFNPSTPTYAFDQIEFGNVSMTGWGANGFAISDSTAGTGFGLIGMNSDSMYFGHSSGATGSAFMTILSSGNVGIGNTGPVVSLNVSGATGSPTASGSTQNAITFVEGSSGSNGLFTGVLTGSPYSAWMQSGFVTPSTGAWYPISLNPLGGNVGIGTTSPGEALQVNGHILINTGEGVAQNYRDLYIGGISGWATNETHSVNFAYNTASSPSVLNSINSIYDGTYGDFNFVSDINGTSSLLYIKGNGDVGIGTTGPSFPLQVRTGTDQEFKVTPGTTVGGTNGVGLAVANDANNSFENLSFEATYYYFSTAPGGGVGIGTASPTKALQIAADAAGQWGYGQLSIIGHSNANQELEIGYNTSSDYGFIQPGKTGTGFEPLALNPSGGNVGIGTTSPVSTLNVAGSTGITWGSNGDSSGLVTVGGQGFGNYTGASLWVNTPTVAAGDYHSGLGVYGSFSDPVSVVNLTAYGVNNPGDTRRSNLALSTTYNGVVSEIMRLTGTTTGGNVGIGTTGPAYLLHVGSASASGTVAEFQNSSGNCTFTPTTSTWSCSSDARLKNDIVDTGVALPWIGDMRIRDFTLKATGEHKTGVIAQEMLTNHPDMVHVGKDGFYTVDDPNPWKLVKAIQELKTDNDNLKAANYYEAAQIRALTARLDAIEATQTSRGR